MSFEDIELPEEDINEEGMEEGGEEEVAESAPSGKEDNP